MAKPPGKIGDPNGGGAKPLPHSGKQKLSHPTPGKRKPVDSTTGLKAWLAQNPKSRINMRKA